MTDFSEEHSGTAKHMTAAPERTVSNTSAGRAIWHDANTARNLNTVAQHCTVNQKNYLNLVWFLAASSWQDDVTVAVTYGSRLRGRWRHQFRVGPHGYSGGDSAVLCTVVWTEGEQLLVHKLKADKWTRGADPPPEVNSSTAT